MKTEITKTAIDELATLLAWNESNRADAIQAGAKDAADYWDHRLSGMKEACRTLLGTWPAVYSCVGYVVVALDGASTEYDYRIDSNTFDIL